MKVTVLGSSNLDLCAGVRVLPAPGQTVGDAVYMEAFGGKGANQAVAAARLGGDVSFVGAVGDDSIGVRMIGNLSNEGIDCSQVNVIESEHSGTALIMVDANGENCIAVCPGANGRLDVDMVSKAEALIASADILVMQAEVSYESVKAAARIAKRSGTAVLYNPAPICEVDDEMMAMTDILVVNEGEGEALSGCSGTHEQIARALLEKGARNVVITLGSKGAYASSKAGEGVFVPAFRVESVDAVGAGDTFCGALAVGYARDHAVSEENIVFATAAAALSVTRQGAQPSIPSLENVIRFIASRS